MKFAVALLALVSVTLAAPQPRKIFHENFEDFVDLIDEEVGDELSALAFQYLEYEEFITALEYMGTDKFRNLVDEMEHLPEFQALQNFLDTHSIDISYFIALFHELLDNRPPLSRVGNVRQSGRDFNSYIKDVVALFPKEKLAALYEEKLASDPDFKAAMEGLESEEFDEIFTALLNNSVFQAEVQALAENGIFIETLLDELVAVFGQDVKPK